MTGLKAGLLSGVAACALFSSGMAAAESFTVRAGQTATTTQVLNANGDTGTVEAGGIIDVDDWHGRGVSVSANDATVDNAGSITVTNENSIGIEFAGNRNSVTNSGQISAVAAAVYGTGDGNSIVNAGQAEGQYGIDIAGAANTVLNTSEISARWAIVATGDDNLITNHGTLQSENMGIEAYGHGNIVDNRGIVSAGYSGLYVTGNGNSLSNSGTVKDGLSAMEAWGDGNSVTNTANADAIWGLIVGGVSNTITNSGRVSTVHTGIEMYGSGNTTVNSGVIETGGAAVSNWHSTGSTIINTGLLTGNEAGIYSVTPADQAGAPLVNGNVITNSGLVDGGVTGIYIAGETGDRIDNSGSVRSSMTGIFLNVTTATALTNTGTVEGETAFYAYGGSGNSIANSGHMEGSNVGLFFDLENGSSVSNTGTVTGAFAGVYAFGGTRNIITSGGAILGGEVGMFLDAESGTTVSNAGTLTGGTYGIYSGGGVGNTIANSGDITGGLLGIHLMEETGTTVTNTGTVTAGTPGRVTPRGEPVLAGIVVEGGSGNTIINSGTIIGAPYAVLLGSSSNRLVLKPGSNIQGMIDFGTGNSLSIGGGMNTALSYAGDPLIDIGTPYVAADGVLATVDPIGFAAQAEMLGDLTRVIADGIDGRLAATRRPGRFTAVTTSGQGIVPASYAPEVDASRPTPWTTGLGTWRSQQEGDSSGGFDSHVVGVMAGVDGPVSDGLRLGGFAGWTAGRFESDANSEEANSDSYFGGVYAGLRSGAHFLDLAIAGGVSHQEGERSVLNNTVAGGIEHAKADIDGMFVLPSATLGTDIGLEGATLTPSLRGRYAALFQPDYEEQGSAADLSVEERMVQLFDMRAQLALAVPVMLYEGTLDVAARLGVDAGLASGDDLEAELLGESLSFSAGDDDETLRGFIGLDLAYVTDGGMRFYAGGEFGLAEHETTTSTASAGFAFSF